MGWTLAPLCVALLIPAPAEAPDDLDRRVGVLVDRIAGTDRGDAQAALDELGGLGERARPATIRRLDDRRPIRVGMLAFRVKHPDAFEAYAHYRPELVVDCLSALLGGDVGSPPLYHRGSDARRDAYVASWRAAALRKVGGRVERDDHRPGRPVVAVTLRGDEVTDLSLSYLAALPNLEQLTIAGSYTTDTLLAHVRPLSSLRELKLEGSSTTEAGRAALGRDLPKLRIVGR